MPLGSAWSNGAAGVHSCGILRRLEWRWGGELRLRSTPRYRLVCICFPTPGRGLPYGSGLGLSRCLGPGECLHSLEQRTSANEFARHKHPRDTPGSCQLGQCILDVVAVRAILNLERRQGAGLRSGVRQVKLPATASAGRTPTHPPTHLHAVYLVRPQEPLKCLLGLHTATAARM